MLLLFGVISLSGQHAVRPRRLQSTDDALKTFVVTGTQNKLCNNTFANYEDATEEHCRSYALSKGLPFQVLNPVLRHDASGCFERPLLLGGRQVVFGRSATGYSLGCPAYLHVTQIYHSSFASSSCSGPPIANGVCEMNECCDSGYADDKFLFNCSNTTLQVHKFTGSSTCNTEPAYQFSPWRAEGLPGCTIPPNGVSPPAPPQSPPSPPLVGRRRLAETGDVVTSIRPVFEDDTVHSLHSKVQSSVTLTTDDMKDVVVSFHTDWTITFNLQTDSKDYDNYYYRLVHLVTDPEHSETDSLVVRMTSTGFVEVVMTDSRMNRYTYKTTGASKIIYDTTRRITVRHSAAAQTMYIDVEGRDDLRLKLCSLNSFASSCDAWRPVSERSEWKTKTVGEKTRTVRKRQV